VIKGSIIVGGCRQVEREEADEEYETLLDKAVANKGLPENIEEWATRIAADIEDV